MTKNAILVGLYALLLLIGGTIGFIKSNSYPSIIAGGGFSLCLFLCSYLMSQGKEIGLTLALVFQSVLIAFFGYRFFATYKFMPSGMMLTLTVVCFSYLLLQKIRYVQSSSS